MNETIGVKGGKNDRRRSLRITKQFKEKLEEYQKEQDKKELEALEKKISFNQKITFIKTLPIVIVGQVWQTLVEDNEKKRQLALKEVITRIERENSFSDKDKERIIAALINYDLFSLDDELLGKLGIPREGYKQVSEIDLTQFTGGKEKQTVADETKYAVINVVKLEQEEKLIKQNIYLQQNNEKNRQVLEQASESEQIEAGITALDSFNDQLSKLKNHRIVVEYENQLKDVRRDLRQLIFEYNIINKESDNINESKEAEELLDRLTDLIKKLEDLKEAIDVENIDKYDQNYLHVLVEDYLQSFKNQAYVDDIKDSSLYIALASKINELDNKKDKLQTKIESKKEILEIDEKRLDDLKERYFNFEKFNNDLLNFQMLQDKTLDEVNQKLKEATTVTERVDVQFRGITGLNRRLMQMLAASMVLPGTRSARSVATLTATSLYFMRNILNPSTVTKRYKVVKTEDYHKEIENSLDSIDDVEKLLKSTSKQLDRTINEIEQDFKEYINVIPECKELLYNLAKIKEQLKEKEYEMAKIKEEQEKNLEKNDAKVKTLNYEYMV